MTDSPVDPEDDFSTEDGNTGADIPTAFPEGTTQSDIQRTIFTQQARLDDIARSLRAGDPVSAVTVRVFLKWFWGTQRRGRWIVSYIREKLLKAGIKTVPDFESAYLDADMSFELMVKEEDSVQPLNVELEEVNSIADPVEVAVESISFADPTYRISKLASANKKPTAVKPDSNFTEAITLMMANDFFQIPVMVNDREVKGIVSWESIGARLAMGQSPQFVREVMTTHIEISSDASLFTAIPIIVEHGYALVRASSDKKIAGIITTSDLSLQFQQLSEPFLLLGEIENHLRKIIASKFNTKELEELKDPLDVARRIRSVADLSFGEYKRLLEDPAKWKTLEINLDRTVFVELLDKVRKTRNEVMHFDPDGIEDKSLIGLRDFARLLRALQTIGAT